jgi:hypothetical protein
MEKIESLELEATESRLLIIFGRQKRPCVFGCETIEQLSTHQTGKGGDGVA